MSTSKKKAVPVKDVAPARKGIKDDAGRKPAIQRSAEYEAALAGYSRGLELLHQKDPAQALPLFRDIERLRVDEPVLAERARTYAAICERRLAGSAGAPRTAEEAYHFGVVKANAGALDDALRLLDSAVEQEPGNASFLYARASVRGLQGNAPAAAADLKKSIALDPHLRHQVGNDEDFENVRDEAVFIDVIEPTPTGV